jgi:hypothetical protein
MTITELKKALKPKKKPELENIVLALYKHIPKKIIENEGIDKIFLLQPVDETKSTKIKIDKELKLILEINNFNHHFLAGNYGIPNRIIPKAKRSKWRFEAMRFYKEINSIFPDAIMKKELADVFGQLYEAMSEGCKHFLVQSDDSFASIQKNQITFFHQLIQYKKEVYVGDELYNQIWNHIIDVGLSGETTTTELYETLCVSFSSHMDIEDLVMVGKIQFGRALQKHQEAKKKNKFTSSYDIEKTLEGLAMLLLKIHETEDARTFFFEHSKIYSNKENMYYALVRTFIDYYDNAGKEILNILDKAIDERVVLRDSLARLHKSLKNDVNCDLPNL